MKLDLDAIEQRCEKATPEPWTTFHPKLRFCANDIVADQGEEPFVIAQMNRNMDDWKQDADFIANARQDIPVLLAFAKDALAALRLVAIDDSINKSMRYFAHDCLTKHFGEVEK